MRALTVIAFVPRLIAAFFSEGYFAHDDHFLVIEAAGSWVDGADYNNWLPWNQGDSPRPSGHSFFFVGLHYLFFYILKTIGVSDPKSMMIAVRILLAIWSLVVVRVGYRIALRLSNAEIAWRTGLFLALFYFMPFLAVRNLVEVACIPFLMLGAYHLVRNKNEIGLKDALIAGIWIGLAINVRFQTLFFAIGPGLAFLLQKKWKHTIYYGIGILGPIVALQGMIDIILWGIPFAEITEYVLYNLYNTTTYGVLPWYNYLLLLAGIYLPFLGLAVLFGFVRRTAPLLLWLPMLLFIAIHSYFPNKQERFLLPIIPLFFVVGHVSWEQYLATSKWWQNKAGLWRGHVLWIHSLNFVILVVLCFTYSKRSRVEALYSLRDHRPLKGIVIEDTYGKEAPMPPLFYLGQWDTNVLPWTDPTADLAVVLDDYPLNEKPEIILFFGEEDINNRIARVTEAMGPLHEIGRSEPGLVDRVVHWLNPVNRNETIVTMATGPQ
ncbi:MAG: glycosyltransferase family 39 protein [Flavobacteriales bacterium]|nr:glycosyltransferase family 39 protein [Flavobacteriales bacterium]MBK6945895.1 glycosyltransferase family 39 protein [Flavobacteriales bacterium]